MLAIIGDGNADRLHQQGLIGETPRGLNRAPPCAVWYGQKSWSGVAILARGAEPVETRRGLPGDPDDTHSRYIEAPISGTPVGCLHLPNGNPAPGPKFDYKLRWFERLTGYARALLESGSPAPLATTQARSSGRLSSPSWFGEEGCRGHADLFAACPRLL